MNLQKRELILARRGANQKLLDIADYVSEIKKINILIILGYKVEKE